MNFKSSPMQRDFYLENSFNEESKNKYCLNFIFEIACASNITTETIKKNILEVITENLILTSHPIFLKSEIWMFSNFSVNPDLISTEKLAHINVEEMKKDDVFKTSFSLLNDLHLFKGKLIESNNSKYLLMAFHHIIFDYFSCMSFLDQILEKINNIPRKPILNVVNEINYTNQEFDKRKNSTSIKKYFETQVPSDYIPYPEKITKMDAFVASRKINFHTLTDASEKSAEIIAAFAKEYFKVSKQNSILIGVPVPNRTRKNKNLISSLVSVLPVYITCNQSILGMKESIYRQLYGNLRSQFFDYTANLPQFSRFQIMFTYYPSNFIRKVKESSIKILYSGSVDSPAPIHLTLNDLGSLEIKVKDNTIINPERFIDDSINDMENFKNGK